jgi:glycosyltransferase involved in cell wall biosynthesis
MEVALVHDWLTGIRGGEKCLEVLCRQFPRAELFTLLHKPGRVSPVIESRPVHTSFLDRVPGGRSYYRAMLPLMPAAIGSIRLNRRFDLVLSLSHCVAKAIRPPHDVPHVCYCFTPMRYAWHQREAYLREVGPMKRLAMRALLAGMRAWDRATAQRVTQFIAISRTVQERIRECYGRESTIIHPPVDTTFYAPGRATRDDYYAIVSALVPYKRIELAMEACERLRRYLLIIGTGPEAARLRARAGSMVHFAGWQSDEQVRHHLQRCRALLFPGEEDFGIVPVEANACGAPVVCYGRGGATETIAPLEADEHPTGVWFEEQTVESLIAALQRFERQAAEISPAECRRRALAFRTERFVEEIRQYLQRLMGERTTAEPLRIAA